MTIFRIHTYLSLSGIISLIAAVLVTTACTDTSPKRPTEVVTAKPKQDEAPKPSKPAMSRELEFFKRQNSDTTEFTLEDEQFFTSMPPKPDSDSEAEAALAIGIVKYVLKLDVTANQYHEQELIKDESEAQQPLATNRVSVEALAIEKGVNFSRALKTNPLLHDLQFYKLCLRAIKSSSNSLEYTNSVNQTIAGELRNWGQQKTDTNVVQEDVVNAVTTNDWERLHEISADVRIGDNILLEGQILADNRRFPEAITKVSQINQESPLFNQAREKVIEFSDRAVQELRQKAAQAFQSSIPMSDPRSRAAYLTRAKSHLEQALQDYPQAPAEQLSTVRENLAVISRDLEKLESAKESVQ